jgi:hypothetical protein
MPLRTPSKPVKSLKHYCAVLAGVQAVHLKKAAYTALVTTNAEFVTMITASLIQGFEAASQSGRK